MKTLLTLCLLSVPCLADIAPYEIVPKDGKQNEFISIKTPAGLVFKNAKIVKITAIEVRFMHDDGVATLAIAGFPPAIQRMGESHDPYAIAKAKIEKAGGKYIAPSSAPPPPKEEQTIEWSKDVKAKAVKKWPNDFSMQQFEIEKQTKAFMSMGQYLKDGIPNIPQEQAKSIINDAIRKWHDEYDMVVYEIEKQAKAYKELHP